MHTLTPKPVRFMGATLRSIREFPEPARTLAGRELRYARQKLIKRGKHMPKSAKNEKAKRDKPWIESSDNIFKDLGYNDEDAANLLARADLMLQIKTIIKERHLTQVEAAKLLKVRQPRVAEINAMKIQDYSVDTLLKYLARLGRKVTMSFSDNVVA